MAYTPYNPWAMYQQPMIQQTQPVQQPMMAQQPVQATPQPQNQGQSLIWVSGEIGAKSYLMAPGNTVLLMDSEASKFYIKSTDNAGMPSLRTFEYKETTGTPQNAFIGYSDDFSKLNEQFVTREEYDALQAEYKELKQTIAEMRKPQPKRKESAENEQ